MLISGGGFYLTSDKDFTYRWAGDNAVVNRYELEEEGLEVHRFVRSVEWFQYIFNNRKGKDLLTADAVIGPIANDTIFDTLGIISSGYLRPEDALKLLMIGPEYTQIAIKTEKAVQQLRFIGSERIERMDRGQKRVEQDAYQKEFSMAMDKILKK